MKTQLPPSRSGFRSPFLFFLVLLACLPVGVTGSMFASEHSGVFHAEIASIDDVNVVIQWSGGEPPYRVQMSGDLVGWVDLGGLTSESSLTVKTTDLVSGSRVFFRVLSGVVVEQSASYRVRFTSLWSRATFATVPGGDHFSGLIGGTHNSDVVFWQPGSPASTGIERMAEQGSKSSLTTEVNNAITAGSAQSLLSGGGLGSAGSQASMDFTVQRSHPLVTITSMIAPSPDWFVGIHGESFLKSDDDWIESLTVDLFPYDAGTDDGSAFTSANAESSPHELIALIADDPLFAPLDPSDPLLPVARFVFERID